MSLPSKVNKENFRLLDMSSDDDSEDLQLEIIPSRKKKVTRRDRNRNPPTRVPEPNIGKEVQCALRWAVRGTLLLWLLMLTWICAALYDQVSTMELEVTTQVSKSSAGVEDALQVCHTAAKELRANATDFNNRISKLEQDYQELSMRIERALKDLDAVSGQLAAAPELRQMPTRLNELQRTIGQIGSQINSCDASTASARKQAVAAVSGVEEVKTLLHQLEARTNETIANVTANSKREDDMKQQIAAINSTVSDKIESLRIRIEEMTKTTSTVAPSTTSTTTTTSTLAPTTTSSSTTLPPDPPGKPPVLQK